MTGWNFGGPIPTTRCTVCRTTDAEKIGTWQTRLVRRHDPQPPGPEGLQAPRLTIAADPNEYIHLCPDHVGLTDQEALEAAAESARRRLARRLGLPLDDEPRPRPRPGDPPAEPGVGGPNG